MEKTLQRCAQILDTAIGYYRADGKCLAASDGISVPRSLPAEDLEALEAGRPVRWDSGTVIALGSSGIRTGFIWLARPDLLDNRNLLLLETLIPLLREQEKREYDDEAVLIHDILLEHIQPQQILVQCEKMHIRTDTQRCIALIRIPKETQESAYQLLDSIYSESGQDILLMLDGDILALVHQFEQDTREELAEALEATALTLQTELDIRPMIAMGPDSGEITHLPLALKQTVTTMAVGECIAPEKPVHLHEELTLERYLYEVPRDVSVRMWRHAIPDGAGKVMDEEMRQTVSRLFQNNLNVSETARQMYLHRNTLVYRLDKLQKATGLDLRKFDDAVTFKIIMTLGSFIQAAGEEKTHGF